MAEDLAAREDWFQADPPRIPPPCTLGDEHLLVRPWYPADSAALYEAVVESLPELLPWLGWTHPNYAQQETETFVRDGARAWNQAEAFNLAILQRATGRVLGGTGVNGIDRHNRQCNLGYWVRTRDTGRGWCTRAARSVIAWAFDTCGFERVQILVEPANLASRRVAEKLHARQEGVLRRHARIHDEQRDVCCYALVRSDGPRA